MKLSKEQTDNIAEAIAVLKMISQRSSSMLGINEGYYAIPQEWIFKAREILKKLSDETI